MNAKAVVKKSQPRKAVSKEPKDTYLVLRVPLNPKPGSVATIEVIATSKLSAKQKMKSCDSAKEGAAYCLVKVEDLFTYRTTFTPQKTKVEFGDA